MIGAESLAKSEIVGRKWGPQDYERQDREEEQKWDVYLSGLSIQAGLPKSTSGHRVWLLLHYSI